MINLKDVITKYPECLESASKLRSYLVDLYPTEKRNITIITTIFDCGIAEEIKNAQGELDEITINSYCNRLENNYAYSPKFSRECLLLWCNIYNVVVKVENNLQFSKKTIKKDIKNNLPKTPKKKQSAMSGKVSAIENDINIGDIMLSANSSKKPDFVIEDGILIEYNGESDSVVIPNSVKVIGPRVFVGRANLFTCCSNLTNIVIPNSVTKIDDYAFYGCGNLKEIAIPDSVTCIGSAAFSACSSLTSVTIGNGVTSIGNRAFTCCSNLTNIVIPNSVTKIDDYAFYGCGNLKEIAIPDSVTYLGEYAFFMCSSLTSISISNNITNIKRGLFDSCCELQHIVLGANITRIEYGAFYNCSKLINLCIPDKTIIIGEHAFKGCGQLISITIPNNVIQIGDFAFASCRNLTSITIPDKVKKIGKYVFSDCEKLKIQCSDKIKQRLKDTRNYKDAYFN